MEPSFWDIFIMAWGAFLLLELGSALWNVIVSAVHDSSTSESASPTQDADESPATTSQVRDAAAESKPSTQVITEETTPQDPKDTAEYLQRQGWEPVHRFPNRYVGYYQGGGVAMQGGLERTLGGRRKFFVKNPPQGFVRKAENGDCLLTGTTELTENAFQVHFRPEPAAFGDGIEVVEEMLEEAYA